MLSTDPLHKADTEAFVEGLLGQMTLDEKIGQLHQYFNFKDFDADLIRRGGAGSVINAAGALGGQGQSASTSAEVCNHIQRLAQESRLKIPQLFGRDVIHGYRTVFPINLGQAAAWNPDLAEQAAAVAAQMVISENTVKGYVSNILSKLHLADRTQAAVLAWREGVVRRG